jgi:flavodoxin I
VKLTGKVDPSAYEFDESEAVIDGLFVGLPLDEDFEPELTGERIRAWVKGISADFGF